MFKAIKTLTAVGALALITACGGGGGGGGSSGPVASTNSFNIQSGWQALASAGFTKTFNITGTCTGTFTITSGAANTAATFEGNTSALSGNEVGTYSWTGCNPASGSTTIIRYFDTNYIPLGRSIVGGNYGVYATAPSIPTSAKVGDVIVVGSMTEYTNSTKSTPAGREDVTLVMEADTATTAVANIITKSYNTSGTLTSTEQNRYKVAANGSLTPASLDIQYANGSTTHLIGN